VKAGRADQLSRATAAIALYTLQTYAPSGGRGNLTSLRGGGPLTTLVLPGGEPTLWHVLWANVPQGKRPPVRDLPRVFPWLAKTRTADRYPATAPAEHIPCRRSGNAAAHSAVIADNASEFPAVTGAVDTTHVTGWRNVQTASNTLAGITRCRRTTRIAPRRRLAAAASAARGMATSIGRACGR
jgi:CRISPR system Cascade subunit CasA